MCSEILLHGSFNKCAYCYLYYLLRTTFKQTGLSLATMRSVNRCYWNLLWNLFSETHCFCVIFLRYFQLRLFSKCCQHPFDLHSWIVSKADSHEGLCGMGCVESCSLFSALDGDIPPMVCLTLWRPYPVRKCSGTHRVGIWVCPWTWWIGEKFLPLPDIELRLSSPQLDYYNAVFLR